MHLHCTQKLLAKLPLKEDGRLRSKCPMPWRTDVSAGTPLSGWHANLLLIQRQQCVLFIHNETRFPVFLPALNKAKFADLDYFFVDGFMNTLLKCGADDALMNRADALLGPLVCDGERDRSVQGTLNQMGQTIKFDFDYYGVSVADTLGYRASAWLAHTPCTVKGRSDCLWPDLAMFELLKQA